MKRYKTTVQTIRNTVNTSAHITKIPTHYKTHTYTNPHIIKPIPTQNHALKTNTYTHSRITKQVITTTEQNTLQIK